MHRIKKILVASLVAVACFVPATRRLANAASSGDFRGTPAVWIHGSARSQALPLHSTQAHAPLSRRGHFRNRQLRSASRLMPNVQPPAFCSTDFQLTPAKEALSSGRVPDPLIHPPA